MFLIQGDKQLQERIAPLNRNEIVFVNNILKRSKAAGSDALPAVLLPPVFAVFEDMLLPLIHKYGKSDSEQKKGMIVKISRNSDCDNLKDISSCHCEGNR